MGKAFKLINDIFKRNLNNFLNDAYGERLNLNFILGDYTHFHFVRLLSAPHAMHQFHSVGQNIRVKLILLLCTEPSCTWVPYHGWKQPLRWGRETGTISSQLESKTVSLFPSQVWVCQMVTGKITKGQLQERTKI